MVLGSGTKYEHFSLNATYTISTADKQNFGLGKDSSRNIWLNRNFDCSSLLTFQLAKASRCRKKTFKLMLIPVHICAHNYGSGVSILFLVLRLNK